MNGGIEALAWRRRGTERESVIVKGVETYIRELYGLQKLLCSVGYPFKASLLTPTP